METNMTLSFNPTQDMNTTFFQRGSEDYDFTELQNVLCMNGRYSPFIFNNNYRRADNYIPNMSNCIVLDFDDGYTMEDFKLSANFAYAIGTTKSHMIDKKGLVCERFRVIIPTGTAIYLNSTEFTEMMQAVFRIYPQADTACKDAARAYSGYTGAKVEIVHGELFDWESVYQKYTEEKEILKRWQQKEKDAKPQVQHDGTKADWYRENWLSDAMFKALNISERMAGGRNNGLYSLARYLKEVELTDTEILEAVEWANTDDLPEQEVKQILRGLRIST